MTVKVRYKAPDGEQSQKLEWAVADLPATANSQGSPDLRFAAAVAAFGMVLRASTHKGSSDLDLVERLARPGLAADADGHRRQFLELVAGARKLQASGWSLGGGADSAGEIRISRQGRREVTLRVAGRRLDGTVGGMPFHVVVKPAEVQGHLGGEPLWMWLRGREADGHIGGRGVGFVLHETPRGHLLRGQSVGHTVRIEEAHGELSWLPSCNRPLLRLPRTALPETTYQGTCASGQRVRVTLPDAFTALPALPRLALLGLLLSEEEEVLSSRTPRLFPVEVQR